MTHQRDGLARTIECLEQCDRHCALSQVPHRPVAANVEYRVKIIRLRISELYCLRKLALCACVVFESRHGFGLIFGQVTLRVDRRLPSFWGRQCQLDASVTEHEVRGREFLQPEPGCTAGVTQNVM